MSDLDLRAKYPDLLQHCFDLSVNDGWEPIVDELCGRLNTLTPLPQVAQIKEKFGTLRVYVDNSSPLVETLVSEAVLRSRTTCERCGSTSDVRHYALNWWRTVCPPCADTYYGAERAEAYRTAPAP